VKSPSKPHTSFRRTPRSNNHAKQQAEPNPVVILATCEGIINEIREKKKKNWPFSITGSFCPPQHCIDWKKHQEWNTFKANPWSRKFGLNPTQVESMIRLRWKVAPLLFPLLPNTASFSLSLYVQFGVQHLILRLATWLSHHVVGKVKQKQTNPNFYHTKTYINKWINNFQTCYILF